VSIADRIALLGLIEEGTRRKTADFPPMTELFDGLGGLIGRTVAGAKIEGLRPDETGSEFHVFKIKTDEGDILGRLHALDLNEEDVPVYYLVHVEVMGAYRRWGLGNLVLRRFGEFLEERSAVGILDNIIDPKSPAYDIYRKNGWINLSDLVGGNDGEDEASPAGNSRKKNSAAGLAEYAVRKKGADTNHNYMIYLPEAYKDALRDLLALKDKLASMIADLNRRREVIDMRKNEVMVRDTLNEFREVYEALLRYFRPLVESGQTSPFMNFMFTKFATKFISFRRRIGKLLGYTGGESMREVVLAPKIAGLPVKSYTPDGLDDSIELFGDGRLWTKLPAGITKSPSRGIEALPDYDRPMFAAWKKKNNRNGSEPLTIGHLLELGFDPTRLKEIALDGESYIFERIQTGRVMAVKRKIEFLKDLKKRLVGARLENALIRINEPLLVIVDRGNGYVLRRKVAGIHWDEAAEILQSPDRAKMNEQLNAIKLDWKIKSMAAEFYDWLAGQGVEEKNLSEYTFFVPWRMDFNLPVLAVEFHGCYFPEIWIA
jgi:hypothetical protein